MAHDLITAQEWELLSFFEVEPVLADPHEPWCYNDAVYCIRQGELSLSVAIAPAYKDVRIILMQNEDRLYELNVLGVNDVRYRNESRIETLEIALTDHDSIRLRVKPRIELLHIYRGDGNAGR